MSAPGSRRNSRGSSADLGSNGVNEVDVLLEDALRVLSHTNPALMCPGLADDNVSAELIQWHRDRLSVLSSELANVPDRVEKLRLMLQRTQDSSIPPNADNPDLYISGQPDHSRLTASPPTQYLFEYSSHPGTSHLRYYTLEEWKPSSMEDLRQAVPWTHGRMVESAEEKAKGWARAGLRTGRMSDAGEGNDLQDLWNEIVAGDCQLVRLYRQNQDCGDEKQSDRVEGGASPDGLTNQTYRLVHVLNAVVSRKEYGFEREMTVGAMLASRIEAEEVTSPTETVERDGTGGLTTVQSTASVGASPERVASHNGPVLIECYECERESMKFTHRGVPPSLRLKTNEVDSASIEKKLRECLRMKLGIQKSAISEESIRLDSPFAVWKQTKECPDIPTCLIVHPVRVHVRGLPDTMFQTRQEEGEEGYHLWHWTPSTILRRNRARVSKGGKSAALVKAPTVKFVAPGRWSMSSVSVVSEDNIEDISSVLHKHCEVAGWRDVVVATYHETRNCGVMLQVKCRDRFGVVQRPMLLRIGPAAVIENEQVMHGQALQLLGRQHVPTLQGKVTLYGGWAALAMSFDGRKWVNPDLCHMCDFIGIMDVYKIERDALEKGSSLAPQMFRSAVPMANVLDTVLGKLLYPNKWKTLISEDITKDYFVGDHLSSKWHCIRSLGDAMDLFLGFRPSSEFFENGRDIDGPSKDTLDLFRHHTLEHVMEEMREFRLWIERPVAVSTLWNSVFHHSLQHGDLHGSNVVLDSQDNVWFVGLHHAEEFDFVFRDLTRIETTILFQYSLTRKLHDSQVENMIAIVDWLYGFEFPWEVPIEKQEGRQPKISSMFKNLSYAMDTVFILRIWVAVYAEKLQVLQPDATLLSGIRLATQFYIGAFWGAVQTLSLPLHLGNKKVVLYALRRIAHTLVSLSHMTQGLSATDTVSTNTWTTQMISRAVRVLDLTPTEQETMYVWDQLQLLSRFHDSFTGETMDFLEQTVSVDVMDCECRAELISRDEGCLESICDEGSIAEAHMPLKTSISTMRWVVDKHDRHLLILGSASAGKTTLMRQMFLVACLGKRIYGLDAKPASLTTLYLPVYIPMVEMVRAVQSHPGIVDSFTILEIYWMLLYGTNTYEYTAMCNCLNHHHLLIFLDGLHEVTQSWLPKIVTLVKALASKGHRIVVGSRPNGWKFMEDTVGVAEEDDIKGFERKLREKFGGKTAKWVWDWAIVQDMDGGAKSCMVKRRLGALRTAPFLMQVKSRAELEQLSVKPILLTMLMHVYNDSLPETRAPLYDRCVKLFLQRLFNPLETKAFMRLLELVAYHLHFKTRDNSGNATPHNNFGESTVLAVARTYNCVPMWNKLKKYIDNGLFPLVVFIGVDAKDENIYRFVHLIFQEFLASSRIATDMKHACRLLNFSNTVSSPRKVDWAVNEDVLTNIDHAGRLAYGIMEEAFGGPGLPTLVNDWSEQVVRLLHGSLKLEPAVGVILALQSMGCSKPGIMLRSHQNTIRWLLKESVEELALVLGRMVSKPVINMSHVQLSEIWLEDCALNVPRVRTLSRALAGNRTVTALNLAGNHINSAGAAMLATCLKQNRSIKRLLLQRNCIETQGAEKIAIALTINHSLQFVNLAQNSIGLPGSGAIIGALEKNKSLTSLIMDESMIGGDFCLGKIRSSFVVNTTMSDLCLYRTHLGPEGGIALADALKKNKYLKSLDVSSSSIGDVGISAIFRTLASKREGLATLITKGNNISANGATAIGDGLKTNLCLVSLELANNEVSNSGICAICESLTINSTLKVLGLSGNSVDQDCAWDLSEIIGRVGYLAELDLENNHLQDRGAVALGRALRTNHSIRRLNIGWNGINDAGIVSFAQSLYSNTWLAELSIGGSRRPPPSGLGAAVPNSVGQKGTQELNSVTQSNECLKEIILADPAIETSRRVVPPIPMDKVGTLKSSNVSPNTARAGLGEGDGGVSLWANSRPQTERSNVRGRSRLGTMREQPTSTLRILRKPDTLQNAKSVDGWLQTSMVNPVTGRGGPRRLTMTGAMMAAAVRRGDRAPPSSSANNYFVPTNPDEAILLRQQAGSRPSTHGSARRSNTPSSRQGTRSGFRETPTMQHSLRSRTHTPVIPQHRGLGAVRPTGLHRSRKILLPAPPPKVYHTTREMMGCDDADWNTHDDEGEMYFPDFDEREEKWIRENVPGPAPVLPQVKGANVKLRFASEGRTF